MSRPLPRGDPALLLEQAASAGIVVFTFQSRSGELRPVTAARSAVLRGRPAAYPGMSLVVSAAGDPSRLLPLLGNVREASLLPVLLVRPDAGGAAVDKLVELCTHLRVRTLTADPHPNTALISAALRSDPLDLGLDLLGFLSWRGHPIARRGTTATFIRSVASGHKLADEGPETRIERGRWLRKLRRLLADARLPTARRLVADIGLIRLAIQLYARPDQSIERAAYDLGYRSPASAARQLRAMLSMPVAGIRRCWPWEWMIDRAWPEPDPRPAATSPRSDDPCERRRVSS